MKMISDQLCINKIMFHYIFCISEIRPDHPYIKQANVEPKYQHRMFRRYKKMSNTKQIRHTNIICYQNVHQYWKNKNKTKQ